MPIQREVLQANVPEVIEAASNLIQQELTGFIYLRGPQGLKKMMGFPHALSIDLTDSQSPKSIQQGLFPEPCPPAVRAPLITAIAGEKDTDMHFVGLSLQPPEKPPDPVEAGGSFDNGAFLGLCEALKGSVNGYLPAFTKGREIPEFHALF